MPEKKSKLPHTGSIEPISEINKREYNKGRNDVLRIRINTEEVDKLRSIAKREEKSVSALVRDWLEGIE
jgi:hypothetical protein